MRLTVLGSCGGWPEAGQACSGYLVEQDGFRLLLDVGYAVVPRLLERLDAGRLDAVIVSHGHPDHCADLNPLLRARALGVEPAPPLPVYAPARSLDAVLALDRPGMLDDSYVWHELETASRFQLGPFEVRARLLPHWVPNVGVRLEAGGRVLAYTGDAGPSDDLVELARDADLLLAEASYPDEVSEDSRNYLSSAAQRGAEADGAGVASLLLTHLMPGTDPQAEVAAARRSFAGELGLATTNLVREL